MHCGSQMSRVNVAIAVAEGARELIYEVAAKCRAIGLEHTSTLPDFGLLLGSVDADSLPRLKAVRGVEAVEVEGTPSRASGPG
jgi:hypothetical protein